MVRGATPDVVLTGVELLADGCEDVPGAGDVVVVDVGGATTDVYSVVTLDPEEAVAAPRGRRGAVARAHRRGRPRDALERPGRRRGGGRPSGCSPPVQTLGSAAAARAADPGGSRRRRRSGPTTLTLARLAATVALRRHARPSDPVVADGPRRPGKDLRSVGLVVGSGGVLRHAESGAVEAVLAARGAGPPRVGGRCPSTPAWWWTGPTSWRPRACSRRTTPPPPPACSAPSSRPPRDQAPLALRRGGQRCLITNVGNGGTGAGGRLGAAVGSRHDRAHRCRDRCCRPRGRPVTHRRRRPGARPDHRLRRPARGVPGGAGRAGFGRGRAGRSPRGPRRPAVGRRPDRHQGQRRGRG